MSTPETETPEDKTSEEETESAGLTLLELVGDPDQAIVHDRSLTINGKTVRFHIKQLSMRECTEIDAKKYSARKSTPGERDISAEQNSVTAWLLHKCVVKNAGCLESPNWVPLWSLQDIQGRSPEFDGQGHLLRRHAGLLGNPTRAAQDLINHLTIACWEVNPSLNPLRQVQALSKLGIG